MATRRYGTISGPTYSRSGGMEGFGKAFVALRAEKGPYKKKSSKKQKTSPLTLITTLMRRLYLSDRLKNT